MEQNIILAIAVIVFTASAVALFGWKIYGKDVDPMPAVIAMTGFGFGGMSAFLFMAVGFGIVTDQTIIIQLSFIPIGVIEIVLALSIAMSFISVFALSAVVDRQ